MIHGPHSRKGHINTSVSQYYISHKATAPSRPVIPFIILPRRSNGRWEEITQTAPQTSQDMLSLGTPNCPSAVGGNHFRNQESRKKLQLWLLGEAEFLCIISASRPFTSLGVIMHSWTWNKTTKLIYTEVDLLHGQNSERVYSALTFMCSKSHGQSPVLQISWRNLLCAHICNTV